MEPAASFAKDYHDVTVLHPMGAAMMIVLSLATILASRRNALIPLLLMISFIPVAQRVSIAGLDFHLIRVIVLFGWIRVMLRGEAKDLKWIRLDTMVILWAGVAAMMYVARMGSGAAVVYQLGQIFDKVGLYFFVRAVVRGREDVERLAVAFACTTIPIVMFFFVESRTGRNIFSVFGGVPEMTPIRQGKLRCQGPFQHPIIAGVYFATMFPLLMYLWFRGSVLKMLVIPAAIASLGVIVFSRSSTPVLTVALTFVGASFFPLRRKMRIVWWSFVVFIILLHFAMKGPVWSLLAKINIFSGSTGYHRFNLFDQAVRRWQEWFVMGTNSTGHWGYSMRDVTNQFVFEAVMGGVLPLAAFIAMLVVVFRSLGRSIAVAERDRPTLLLLWALGVIFFAHIATFFSLTYFAQMVAVFHMGLGLVGSMTQSVRGAVPAAARPRAAPRRAATPQPVRGVALPGRPPPPAPGRPAGA